MPLHPAPPTDLPGLVDAFEQTVQAIIDLGHTCSAADFEKPTACPGWTVKDQFSHVAGLETWFDGGKVPSLTLPPLAHVRAGTSEFIELFVEERRSYDGLDVVGELEDVLARRLTTLRDPAFTAETTMKGLTRPGPAGTVMRFRLTDVWVHEQDIREALGRPGHLDSAGAAGFVSVLFSALPKIVARDAAVPLGETVILDVTGPVVGRAGVRVVEGEDGRVHGEELFTGDTSDESPAPGQTTSITLSTDALTRRGAGRRSVDDLTFSVHGDEQVARRVLEHLAVTP